MERLPRVDRRSHPPAGSHGTGRAWRCAAVLLMITALAVTAGAGDRGETEVVVRDTLGSVNWTRGYIEVQAEKTPAPNIEIAQTAALATAAAREKLAAAAYRLPLDTFRRVRDLDGKDHGLLAAIRRLVAGLPVYKQRYLSDGTVRIRLRMALTGDFAELVLPSGIRHIESIRTVKATRGRKIETLGTDTSAPVTGLVIDARGTGLQPALVPGILDEDGRQLYGEKYVSRESVVRWGMCRYFLGLTAARRSPRVAGHPLVIRGLRAAGPGKTSVVINSSDAEKIRSASEVIALLRNCRVVIVLGGTPDA